MQVIRLKDLSKKDYQRNIRRSLSSQAIDDQTMAKVKRIVEDVRDHGDAAIIEYGQQRYGGQYRSIRVDKKQTRRAYQQVDDVFIKGLKQIMKNIKKVHQAQLVKGKEKAVFPEPGIAVWRVWRAIERVGIYVPGGQAIYPSSVLMAVIPAQVAGCKEIIVCSPPDSNSKLPPATLVAADMVGVKKIYALNGVQAIGAMALGTDTIPKVDKIVGPGGAYVTATKMLVSGEVDIDMPAGPSEVFVIADETANPAFIAADLLADGEHGFDSACVLVTTSKRVAKETVREIDKQLGNLSTADRVKASLKAYGLLTVVDSLDEAIAFANEYAPEHLTIMTKRPQSVVKKITNAGSVFLGPWTTKSSGDYATGANHILPTGGMAKSFPPLSTDSFGKWMQVQKCTKKGLAKIRHTVETLSEVERLPAHKVSTSIRFSKAP